MAAAAAAAATRATSTIQVTLKGYRRDGRRAPQPRRRL